MKKVASITETVAVLHLNGEEVQVCATVESEYSESRKDLMVQLNAFLRPVDQLHAERHIFPGWLPKQQNLREHCEMEEASEVARETFHHWVVKVRKSIPGDANSNPTLP
ncbi:MAG TPA: hypothetical protein VK968_15750 [Roseimicrobium sp.]|nr:hypothetical protein [Roseimicrobium sp.]